MVDRDFLAAERLLAALRDSGCTLAVDGDKLVVHGPLTDARRAASTSPRPTTR